MTYRRLLKELQEMDPLCLDDNVTIYFTHNDEFYPAESVARADKHEVVLDEGHYFIKVF